MTIDRDTTEIEPMVPEMSTRRTQPDGGARRPFSRGDGGPEQPPRTDYASEFTRDREEIDPMVPDMTAE
jgi:hypothetical protein